MEKKCLQLAQGFSDLFSATESAVVSLLRYKVEKAEDDEKEGQVRGELVNSQPFRFEKKKSKRVKRNKRMKRE